MVHSSPSAYGSPRWVRRIGKTGRVEQVPVVKNDRRIELERQAKQPPIFVLQAAQRIGIEGRQVIAAQVWIEVEPLIGNAMHGAWGIGAEQIRQIPTAVLGALRQLRGQPVSSKLLVHHFQLDVIV